MPTLAFLGLGAMGMPMATRLLELDPSLTVWNRSPERLAPLLARGARRAATPRDAARKADVILLMLADPPAVERVLLADDGVLRDARRDALIIDCSTVGPEDSRTFAATAGAAGVGYIDAPVVGSLRQAEAGELVALVGGDAEHVRVAEPVLHHFAKRVVRAGGTGQGSALKLVMNLIVGGLTEVMAEAILLSERAGLPPDVVKDTLLSSVLASPFVSYKAPQLFERRFAPLFSTQLMLKDLDLALHLARDLEVVLPATREIRERYARAAASGHLADDFAAVIDALAAEHPADVP